MFHARFQFQGFWHTFWLQQNYFESDNVLCANIRFLECQWLMNCIYDKHHNSHAFIIQMNTLPCIIFYYSNGCLYRVHWTFDHHHIQIFHAHWFCGKVFRLFLCFSLASKCAHTRIWRWAVTSYDSLTILIKNSFMLHAERLSRFFSAFIHVDRYSVVHLMAYTNKGYSLLKYLL